jgi:uncharacterized flavoprotein (TIGR03862 family)
MEGQDTNATPEVAVFGAGPAGLRAAEVIAAQGFRVTVFDQKPSPGRKFLVAGRGGLNLTHSEPESLFLTHYRGGERWKELLDAFSQEDLREWAASLGVQTFVGTSGRVFPMEKQAGRLLRNWLKRLRASGVKFEMRSRFAGFQEDAIRVADVAGSERVVRPAGAVFALGGGSWPQTGSDAVWTQLFQEQGIRIIPLQPSNCGFNVEWPPALVPRIEGLPLKNIAASAGSVSVRGEVLLTKYGIEGGAIYRLTPELRSHPQLTLDLKPDQSPGQLLSRLRKCPDLLKDATRGWRLSSAAAALMEFYGDATSSNSLVKSVKALRIPLTGPRPLQEAISSAGGVAWSELEDTLMLRRHPGWFVAGEMIDWEAPTGGYLLQGCFVTGTAAGLGLCEWLRQK